MAHSTYAYAAQLVCSVFTRRANELLKSMHEELEPRTDGRPEEYVLAHIEIDMEHYTRRYVFCYEFVPISTPINSYRSSLQRYRILSYIPMEEMEDISYLGYSDRVDFMTGRVIRELYESVPIGVRFDSAIYDPLISTFIADLGVPQNTTDTCVLGVMVREVLYATPNYVAEGLVQRRINRKEASHVSRSEEFNRANVRDTLREDGRHVLGKGGRFDFENSGAGISSRRVRIKKQRVTAKVG